MGKSASPVGSDAGAEHLPQWVKHEFERADEARALGQSEAAEHPRASAVRFDARRGRIVLRLSNGVEIAFPTRLVQGLADAKAEDLASIEISPQGTLLHWPRLDVSHSVANLAKGLFGAGWWMSELAARGGRSRSAAKTTAARSNGVKGGRPRKRAPQPAIEPV